MKRLAKIGFLIDM